MKIHWGRIVIAGLVAEILGVVSVQSIYRLAGAFWGLTLVAGVISFAFMLLGTLWVVRKIDTCFVLQGILVGVVAIVFYILLSLPLVLRGQYPVNYWLAALTQHPPKILGGALGGFLAGRRAMAKGLVV